MLQIPTSLCGSWRDRGRDKFPTIRHVLGFLPTVQAPAARGGVHSFFRCREIWVTAWQGPVSNMIKQHPLRRLHGCWIDGTAWSLSWGQARVFSGMFVFVRQQRRSSGTRWSRTCHIRWSRVSRTQAWGRWTWLHVKDFIRAFWLPCNIAYFSRSLWGQWGGRISVDSWVT